VSAPWYSELFSAHLRYCGASLGFQVAGAINDGLTPFAAAAFVAWTGAAIGLSYSSQQESLLYRSMRRSQKLRIRLGGSPSVFGPKPRGMRTSTYRNLLARVQLADAVLLTATEKRFGSI
jgi:hypothetical protein